MRNLFRARVSCLALAMSLGCAVAAEGQEAPLGQADEPSFRERLGSASEALQREQLAEAERLFTEALRMRPQSKDARFGMGALLIKQSRYAEAIAIMEELMDEYPDEFPVMNNLAWLYATASDHTVRNGQRAVSLAQKALLLQPNNFHVWNTLSEGHYVSGDYERALRAAQEALRLSMEAESGRERILEYRRQVEKSRRAAEAMTILE